MRGVLDSVIETVDRQDIKFIEINEFNGFFLLLQPTKNKELSVLVKVVVL